MTDAQITLVHALQAAQKALREADDAMCLLPSPLAHAGYLEGAMASVEMMLDELQSVA